MEKTNISYKKHFSFLICSAILLWLVFDYTNIDMYLSSLFFDYKTASWPYYNNFWTATVGYVWIKYLIIIYSISLLLLFVYSYKNTFWQTKRILLLFLLLSMIIIPSEISLLKHTFYKSRPEQVIEFGGNLPHVNLFEFLFDKPNASNWPGGHASGGAALMSLYFVGIHISRFWGIIGLLFGITISQLMGFVQVMRGQHFFSHNLWTLWFAWLTIVLLYFFMTKYDKFRFSNCKKYFSIY